MTRDQNILVILVASNIESTSMFKINIWLNNFGTRLIVTRRFHHDANYFNDTWKRKRLSKQLIEGLRQVNKKKTRKMTQLKHDLPRTKWA